jgi:phosphoserine phosphatase
MFEQRTKSGERLSDSSLARETVTSWRWWSTGAGGLNLLLDLEICLTILHTPASLSTTEFLARVYEAAPRVAVFDCDGTLWKLDSGSSFMRWTMEKGLLSAEAVAWVNERYEGYKSGQVSELAICGEMVQVYRGIPEETLRKAAAEFFRERIEPHIFPEMLQVVRDLQSAGAEIWAVSSTCDWVVEEGVKRFGIPANRVLAACVECTNGVATDRLRDVPTDEGKVASLARAGVTSPDAVFGNSVHDAAMLSIARHPFPVNPSVELASLSAEQGWPVYYPTPSVDDN